MSKLKELYEWFVHNDLSAIERRVVDDLLGAAAKIKKDHELSESETETIIFLDSLAPQTEEHSSSAEKIASRVIRYRDTSRIIAVRTLEAGVDKLAHSTPSTVKPTQEEPVTRK